MICLFIAESIFTNISAHCCAPTWCHAGYNACTFLKVQQSKHARPESTSCGLLLWKALPLHKVTVFLVAALGAVAAFAEQAALAPPLLWQARLPNHTLTFVPLPSTICLLKPGCVGLPFAQLLDPLKEGFLNKISIRLQCIFHESSTTSHWG